MCHFFLKIMEFTQHSTGLSFGNLVDGLPGALHTEAGGWAPTGRQTAKKSSGQQISIGQQKRKVDKVLKLNSQSGSGVQLVY